MIVKFAEVTNQFNWGKFMIARFTDDEWRVKSKLDGFPLLSARGWTSRHIWVCDVQTGEGAFFAPPGSAKADLDKHAIWVCPMFPLFLGWLYEHPEQYIAIMTIPDLIELSPEETAKYSALYGFRRPGSDAKERDAKAAETKLP